MQWLTRRKVHLERAELGITMSRISEYGVTSSVCFFDRFLFVIDIFEKEILFERLR